jgi:hypothetical protein
MAETEKHVKDLAYVLALVALFMVVSVVLTAIIMGIGYLLGIL